MTLLAERENARTDLVAASHSLRLLIVTVTIPFALQWSGLHGLAVLPPTIRLVDGPGLVLLALLTGAGALGDGPPGPGQSLVHGGAGGVDGAGHGRSHAIGRTPVAGQCGAAW